MDPYLPLKTRAAQKRDAAIAEARRVYRKDIEAIEALERRLPASRTTDPSQLLAKPPSIVDLIRAVVPADKPFTVSDVMVALGEAHQGQKFHLPTVRTHTSRLCSRGFLRRLYKTSQQETMYALAVSPVTEGALVSKNLATVAHEVLTEAGKPLEPIEIAVCMRERGYRADDAPAVLVAAIRGMFRNYPGRFVQDGKGRWAAAN
jgi:hypothetical protein